MSGINLLNELFLDHSIKIKMYHFQTKQYGIHKALDAYLEQFLQNYDRYMESYQGKTGERINSTHIKLNIKLWNDLTAINNLKTFRNLINELRNNQPSQTILDEMIVDINQLLYLLTFK